MSRESMMAFAEAMFSRSAFLRSHCADVEEFRDPDYLLPVSMLGYFGQTIAINYTTIRRDEWHLLSAMIEDGLASADDDVGTAVATGLIEGLIHRAEMVDGLWPKVEADLGPKAREYADAYRNWGKT